MDEAMRHDTPLTKIASGTKQPSTSGLKSAAKGSKRVALKGSEASTARHKLRLGSLAGAGKREGELHEECDERILAINESAPPMPKGNHENSSQLKVSNEKDKCITI